MKKIMQGISVLIILFAVLTVPVVADSPPPIICQATLASAASTTVSIEDASAPQGGTVTVPINIAGVENMCGANIWLNYNKDVVIVDSVSDGDLVPLTHNIDNPAGITKINWDTTSGMTGDFVFASVTLKAVGNPGDTCLLDLDVKELYDCVPPFNEIPRTVADGTFTIPSECGNMNVNPTSWSPTINCGESDNEIITVSATGGTVEGVTVSKESGPTWLSVSPTDLGNIPSGSSKTFTMTASPPSETSGDFPYTVTVSNTCGTPSSRDVSGTIHVPCPCGDMTVNPTSWSPTIDCGESDSQIVTVSASDGTVKVVTVSKESGPTWLSVSPTNLGDMSSGSSKTFTMTASPPAGTSGDFPYSVTVSNTCGTPSSRDVTGTIVKPPSETEVSIEDASAPQGGTVTVPIKIVDVENMCGANIWLNYNKEVVTVDSVSDGALVPLTHSIDNTAGVTKMTWDTTSGMTGDFVFAYVTLKAVGNPGDTCLLDLDVNELYDCVPPFNEIPRTVADGTFTIPSECEGTDTSCGIYPDCEKCTEKDGCYPYGNGCEERAYYCKSNEEGCDYTHSNRHTDEWVDTGNTSWVDDPENECKEKKQKAQEYHDYTCSDGTCTYSVTDTQWIDTGDTRDKDDGTICDCTASNTLKRCYSGVCTDTGICDSTTCGADAACDGKKPGDSCGGGTCDSNCKCRDPGEDYGVFRNGVWGVDTTGNHVADVVFGYGIAGDIPLVGDIDQDRTGDIGIFRNGIWCVDTTGNHIADLVFGYGILGDIPLVGDIDQDGTDDIAIFRNGIWCVDTTGNHMADLVFGYGIAGDVPLVGDIDQDGTDDIAIFRNGIWCVDTTGNHVADVVFGYGIAGDVPLVGDMNRDGISDIGIFRNGVWCVDTTGNHIADLVFGYGIAGDIPVVGDIE